MSIHIRPLRLGDLLWLAADLDASFTGNVRLVLTNSGQGLEQTWQLQEQPLARAIQKRYPLGRQDLSEMRERLQRGEGLLRLAVEVTEEGQERMAALLDVRAEMWNRSAVIWNLLVDRRYQRQGIGHMLLGEAVAWTRAQGLRALRVETQNTNVPACRFYLAHGFELTGFDRAFYAPKPGQEPEVALFFTLSMTSQPPVVRENSRRPRI